MSVGVAILLAVIGAIVNSVVSWLLGRWRERRKVERFLRAKGIELFADRIGRGEHL